jgi:putative NADH-flavin reductase
VTATGGHPAPGRLAVVGATGGTGREVVRQALDAGMAVTALARRPESLPIAHLRLTVVKGDILCRHDARAVVAGNDAVISTLGIGHSRAATTVYSTGTASLLAAMRSTGVSRPICLSTSALQVGPAASWFQRMFTKHVLQRLLSRPYADMRRMEMLVRSSSAAWTVVRAARLTDGERTGTYRLGHRGTLPSNWSISRADLAECLLSLLGSPDSYRQTLDVAY